jgi:DNA-dependent protein kinase catalytic subunit
MLSADIKCSQRRLKLETYAVLPVSKRSGILEWVKDTRPMSEHINTDEQINKDHLSVAEHEYVQMHGVGWETYIKSFKAGHADNSESFDRKFTALVEKVPSDLMRQGLLAHQSSAQAQYMLRSNFATSLSAMNASHYVLGIGDRHNANTLVTDRGLLVGIDFGDAFGKGAWAKQIPELVPFRLTRQMLGVLSPLDSQALLQRSMTCVMLALRANKHLIKQNLSIFLEDPTMDWIIDNKKQAGAGGAGGGGGAGQGHDKFLFLKERMQVLDCKLEGSHPCDVMLHEVGCNRQPFVIPGGGGLSHIVNRHLKGFEAILGRVKGSPVSFEHESGDRGGVGRGGRGGGAVGRHSVSGSSLTNNNSLSAADQVLSPN